MTSTANLFPPQRNRQSSGETIPWAQVAQATDTLLARARQLARAAHQASAVDQPQRSGPAEQPVMVICPANDDGDADDNSQHASIP
jgi:hypothetical protein